MSIPVVSVLGNNMVLGKLLDCTNMKTSARKSPYTVPQWLPWHVGVSWIRYSDSEHDKFYYPEDHQLVHHSITDYLIIITHLTSHIIIIAHYLDITTH